MSDPTEAKRRFELDGTDQLNGRLIGPQPNPDDPRTASEFREAVREVRAEKALSRAVETAKGTIADAVREARHEVGREATAARARVEAEAVQARDRIAHESSSGATPAVIPPGTPLAVHKPENMTRKGLALVTTMAIAVGTAIIAAKLAGVW